MYVFIPSPVREGTTFRGFLGLRMMVRLKGWCTFSGCTRHLLRARQALSLGWHSYFSGAKGVWKVDKKVIKGDFKVLVTLPGTNKDKN
jgi:hypothetical protein